MVHDACEKLSFASSVVGVAIDVDWGTTGAGHIRVLPTVAGHTRALPAVAVQNRVLPAVVGQTMELQSDTGHIRELLPGSEHRKELVVTGHTKQLLCCCPMVGVTSLSGAGINAGNMMGDVGISMLVSGDSEKGVVCIELGVFPLGPVSRPESWKWSEQANGTEFE